MIKRLTIIFMLLALAVGPMALAIEKTKPSNNPAPQQKPKGELSPRQERPVSRPADSVDYDHFIDRNNNGIDDRAESTRQKPSDRADSIKESSTLGNSADSTKK